jgi:sugar phosphate isomerase/epimerase
MYNISICTGNGITPEFADFIGLSSRLGINNLETESRIDGIDITELKGNELEGYRNMLISGFKKIVLLKADRNISDQAYYRKLFRNAHLLGVGNICLEPGSIKADDVKIAEIRNVINIGKSYGIGILFENSSTSSLNNDKALSAFYRRITDDNTGIIFNPLEYCRMKSHPFFHEYYNSRVKKEIRFLRVNDGLFKDGSPAFPGEGNAEIREMVSILLSIGFNGYFSITPYFGEMNFEKYEAVAAILKDIFRSI